MARRRRSTYRARTRRTSYTGRRSTGRRSFRSTSRRANRVEIVVRQEAPQAVAGPMPMVVDNGRLKIAGDAPKKAQF